VIRAAVDTGALLALASSRDQYHAKAVQTATRVRAAGGRWLGTMLVLAELHGHLIRRIDPRHASRIVAGLLADPMFEWHDVSADLVPRAIEQWLHRYDDQTCSLTDAVTFELMRREKLTHAFAYDQHFVTAGFELLAS
jgi:predicted nucleic acid-binding protein